MLEAVLVEVAVVVVLVAPDVLEVSASPRLEALFLRLGLLGALRPLLGPGSSTGAGGSPFPAGGGSKLRSFRGVRDVLERMLFAPSAAEPPPVTAACLIICWYKLLQNFPKNAKGY